MHFVEQKYKFDKNEKETKMRDSFRVANLVLQLI